MQKQTKFKFGFLVVGFLLGVVITACGAMVYIQPTDRVIQTWKQPDDIKYDSFGPYYLSVVEEGMDISRFPFSTKRRYYIYVGKDSGKPIYGHVIDYSFHPDTSDIYNIAQHIKKSDVVWSAEGVTFNEASGHKVFIPKSMLRGR